MKRKTLSRLLFTAPLAIVLFIISLNTASKEIAKRVNAEADLLNTTLGLVHEVELQDVTPKGVITIPDLIAKMGDDRNSYFKVKIADEQITFDAIVSSDPSGGNTPWGTIYIMTEGTVKPNNGLELYYTSHNDYVEGLGYQDRVRITLPKGAEASLNNGVPRIDLNWYMNEGFKIEKLGTKGTVEAAIITLSQWKNYKAMPVVIRFTTLPYDIDWEDGAKVKCVTNEGDGGEFEIEVSKNSRISGQRCLGDRSASITGIAGGKGEDGRVIYPRNIYDIAEYILKAPNTPSISKTSVSIESMEGDFFDAELKFTYTISFFDRGMAMRASAGFILYESGKKISNLRASGAASPVEYSMDLYSTEKSYSVKPYLCIDGEYYYGALTQVGIGK